MACWSRRPVLDCPQGTCTPTHQSRRLFARSKKQYSWFVPYCCEAVVTGRREARDAGELSQATVGTPTGQDGDDVDGFRNQGTRDGDDSFLDELLEPAQRADCGACMDGADAARVPRAPGFD